jgi:two-component system, OmpR family, sensor histidine kinase MprB
VKLRTRIALMAALLVACATTATALFGHSLARSSVKQEVERALRADAQRIGMRYLRVDPPKLGAQSVSAVVDASGAVVESTFVLERPLGVECGEVAKGSRPSAQETQMIKAERTELLCLPLVAQVLGVSQQRQAMRERGAGLAIVVGRNVESADQQLDELRTGFLAIGIGATALALLGIALGVSFATRPITRLVETTNEISTDLDLNRRVHAKGPTDLAALAASFNRMMVALADAQDRQRKLIDNASHELRTPVTSISANLELLRRRDEFDADTVRSLEDQVAQQFKELAFLVSDLQYLSDIPTFESQSWTPIDLADVTTVALSRVSPRAQGVQFETRLRSLLLRGDATDLDRAVTNVLDNAIKWSPASGVVTVTIHDRELTISDQGPGLTPEERKHAFDRFWRSPGATAVPGSGLGLAIVSEVMNRHGGRVSIGPHDGQSTGTTVTMSFPMSRPTKRS